MHKGTLVFLKCKLNSVHTEHVVTFNDRSEHYAEVILF